MKITDKIIEEVVTDVAGADVVPLVSFLKNKKNISEFIIAEKIDKEINATRNMLYRLFDYNLVSFIRKKDKKKGWYIYYWTFNPKRVRYILFNLKKKKVENLKERLKRENSSDFFICKIACVRLDFEQATNFEYKCPECGSLMNQENNVEKKKEIEEEIKKIEKEIKEKFDDESD
jgi:transcription initiation factor TFIIE subunit alpha|tara:strand:- start:82 stop:606 length:525 start_codon:yes stop_codon:yes gene_type:complete